MSHYKTEHFCVIENIKKSAIPKLSPSTTWCQKFIKFVKSITIISAKNPQTTNLFHSSTKVKEEIERHLSCKYFVIHPLSSFTQYWQFLMCVVWYINLTIGLTIPMFQVFILVTDETFRPFFILYELTNHICVLDIIVNFLTGYIKPRTQQCVLDRKKIAMHYATTYLSVDILVFDFILSFTTFFPNFLLSHHIIFGIWKLIRVIRLKAANEYLEYFLVFLKLHPEYYRVIVLIIKGFFLVHVNTMAYIYIPGLTMRENTWMTRLCKKYQESKNDIFKENIKCTLITGPRLYYYINHSYYETFARICLIFWGKISPETWEDSWLACITLMCGFCYNIYFIVFLKAIMESSYITSLSFDENVFTIKSFCTKHMLPEEMEKKLLRNFEETFRGEYYNKKKFDRFISDILKGDLFAEHRRNQGIIEKSNIFSDISRTAYIAIIESLKRGIYFPGDVIESIGSRKKGMYFIATGSVAVYDDNGKELYHLEEGDHFGVHTMYPRSSFWHYSVIAIEVCEIYRISKRDYERRILEHDWAFLDRLTSSVAGNRRNTVANIITTLQFNIK